MHSPYQKHVVTEGRERENPTTVNSQPGGRCEAVGFVCDKTFELCRAEQGEKSKSGRFRERKKKRTENLATKKTRKTANK